MVRALRILQRLHWNAGLEVCLPGRAPLRYGPTPPAVCWRFRDAKALGRIARNPELALGETYMAGAWEVQGAPLADLLGLLVGAAGRAGRGRSRLECLLGNLLQQWNRVRASYRNVARHYDLPDWLFERFLDADRHYSCAYFQRPDLTLEEAQRAKVAHIRAKLLLEPGMRVLDIGCGWGSLALALARDAGVHVTGITLSAPQLAQAQARAREAGLEDRVRFAREDYREHRGRYDRVVSVGMFEHVGRPWHARYFRAVHEFVAGDGVALVHSIARLGPPGVTSAWIRRYIFPGGYNPSLSELVAGAERGGLMVSDVEVLRTHYAHTLHAWQARFQAARTEVVERLGERFARMWEFYLAVSEAAMRCGDLAVAQVQLARRLDALPITRDYLHRTPT
jgi:cyclopropane-fatty-acyl-phospholipid synthase